MQSVSTVMAAADEWQAYLDITSREVILTDITAFWHAVEDRLPRLTALAKVYIALPISSVDVERSFSKYGSVLSVPVTTAVYSVTGKLTSIQCRFLQ